MAYIPLEEFGIMRNLRTVGIAKTHGNTVKMQGKAWHGQQMALPKFIHVDIQLYYFLLELD